MESATTFKIQVGGELRRVVVEAGTTLSSLERVAAGLFSPASEARVALKYVDSDGDVVTLGSDAELSAFCKETKTPRLEAVIVEGGAAPAPPASAPAKPKETNPSKIVARALSSAEAVRSLQSAVASPIVNETVTQIATAFMKSPMDAFVPAMAALPALLAVVNEAVDRDADLAEARKELSEMGIELDWESCMRGGRAFGEPFAEIFGHRGHHRGHHGHHHGPGHHEHDHPHHGGHHSGGHPCGPPHHGPHGGAGHPCGPPHHGPHGGAGHPCGPPHHGPHGGGAGREIHPFVVCDGCDKDILRKRVNTASGFVSPRGWIVGQRYKSETVHNFDLCGGCHQSGHMNAFGPFVVVPGQTRRQFCQRPSPPTPRAAAPPASSPTAPDFGALLSGLLSQFANSSRSGSNGKNDFDLASIAQAVAESLKVPEAPKPEAAPSLLPVAGITPVVVASPAASEHGDWTAVEESAAAQVVDPMTKWGSELARLATLGFVESETYLDMLEEEGGDLEKVVNRIVRRAA